MFDFDVRAGEDDTALSRGGWHRHARAAQYRAPGDQLSMTVAMIPRRAAVLVGPTCSVRDAFRQMAESQATAALVVSHGVLLGVVSERQIVRGLLEADAIQATVPVLQMMEPDAETLVESDNMGYAIRKLWVRGGRSLAIVRRDGTPVGVLETQDVVGWMLGRGDAAAHPRRLAPARY